MHGGRLARFQLFCSRLPFLTALLLICCVWIFLIPLTACASPPSKSSQTSSFQPPAVSGAEVFTEEGYQLLRKGQFEKAIPKLSEALKLYEKSNAQKEQSQVMIDLASAYQAIGEYQKALRVLQQALVFSRKAGNPERTARVLGAIGNVYIALGPEEDAYRYLSEGLAMARQEGKADVCAEILNNLGNLFAVKKNYGEAARYYGESASLAEETSKHALAATAATNQATALMHEGFYAEARQVFGKASTEAGNLLDSHDKTYILINIGLGYWGLHHKVHGPQPQLLSSSETKFLEAMAIAESADDFRSISYASGYLGKLGEEEHKYQEAMQLTERAIVAAQRANAPESLYRWEWQKGRLIKALGKIDEAIPSYRSASATLGSIRNEMSNCYGGAGSSFREPADPLYLEFVDLLLQRAALTTDQKEYEPYLLEARKTLESLKASELRDYFRDDCVDAFRSVTTKLDVVSKSAVVIYPILLQDRTELLVNLPSGMKRFSVPVNAQMIGQEVRSFRRNLEKLTTREFLPHAQKLYNWLIRPLEKDLQSVSVDTLVFVPDGPLRTVPMAALHDGNQFLANKYAIAITPGLDLTDPRPIERKNLDILVLGLTEPVQGFPSLPYVFEELESIQKLYKCRLLVDRDFVLPSIERSLREEPFTVVHIASHGEFEKNIDKTFLLTFDDKLTMDRLNQYIGLLRFRQDPLELLTLSACETAEGEDRAALGLAGVAIKAGARSALGTLWHINDRASSVLMAEFYHQLQDPSVSRAAALRQAQLKLLHDKRYQHPGYWSPFLLINNWL